jgi:hypothetical protein
VLPTSESIRAILIMSFKEHIPFTSNQTNQLMKINFLLLALIIVLTLPFKASSIPPNKIKRPIKSFKVKYETDGHYWTVLVVATLLKVNHAKEIAYHAEYPDNIINADGYLSRHRITFMYPWAQKKIHALSGGDPTEELAISKEMFGKALSDNDIGVAAHRLGDSFAHINDKKGRMYPHIIAHLFQWKRPDKIRTNPSKYLTYVNQLVKCMGGDNAVIDMTVFNYIANAKLSSDENSAILKAEYNYLNDSPAFCIEKNEIAVVQQYLKQRFSSLNRTFTTFSSTNQKGKITTVIILIAKETYATRLPE